MNAWRSAALAAAAFCLGYLAHSLSSVGGNVGDDAALAEADARYFARVKEKAKRDCPTGRGTKVLLTFGQSNSANSVGHRSTDATGRVFNWFAGNCYTAADPLLGATGEAGNIWIGVAAQLLRGGFANDIVIVPLGVSGSSVKDWQRGRTAAERLEAALTALAQAGLKVDFFLWVQGERDVDMGALEYSKLLGRVIDHALARFPAARFGIAGTSYCRGRDNPQLVAAQQALPQQRASSFFLGSTDAFRATADRYDDCHFSPTGAQKVAALFAKNIAAAAR